jgi:hypothetical protein
MGRGTMPVQRKITEQWELVCESEKAELYRVRKEHPDGSCYIILYRGLTYSVTPEGTRIRTPDELDFETALEGKEWFDMQT